MRMVLTLIVNPEKTSDAGKLLKRCIKTATDAIQSSQGLVTFTYYLADNEAVDLFFDTDSPDDSPLRYTLLVALSPETCDWYLQPVLGRRKRMLIADMDSTMIEVECIDELADFAGLKDKVSAITEAAMRGELDFAQALRERVALLQGMDSTVLEQCYRERVTFTPGAFSLVQTMAAEKHLTALVSGGFTFFTDRVAEKLGFGFSRANVLEISDGKLTGAAVPPICDATTKRATLVELAATHAIDHAAVLAVGDGANDIPMIQEAGLGVAFHAKEKAREAASFAVNHCDLTALLYVQGYHSSSIVREA